MPVAASVLGKRPRRVHEEETDLSLPTKRRLTRRATPQIYEDTSPVNYTAQAKVLNGPQQRASRSVSARNTRTKRIVQNDPVQKQVTTIDATVADIPTSADAAKENIPPSNFSTPTAVRFKDALANNTPSTPKHRVRLAGKFITPRSNRSATTPRAHSVYAAARQMFTSASQPTRLVGRDEERQQMRHFISTAVEAGKGGCTYVSGPPGTGKSALVQEVFQEYQGQDGVNISVVNCIAFKSSSEVLGKLAQDFSITSSGNGNITKQSLSTLFTTKEGGSYLVLLDEIDSLLDGDCGVLYSIFEWALHRSSSLILVGIANALDLTDRFLPRLKTHGLKPTLLPFLPYTATQISNIITDKLRSLLPADNSIPADFVPFVHPAAIQLSGKKIASQTGDLRKAFNLIRRVIDQVEQETSRKLASEQAETPTKQPLSELANGARDLPPTPPTSSPLKPTTPEMPLRSALSRLTVESAPRASIAHVARLASSIFNNGIASRLSNLNLQQKAVLCSLVASEKRQNERDPYKTPSKSWGRILTVKDLFEKYGMLCRRDEGLLQPLKNTEFRDVVASLETLGLVHESAGRNSSLLTPTKTPSRAGRNLDERMVVSAVSEQEMREGLQGPGGDLLQRLLNEK